MNKLRLHTRLAAVLGLGLLVAPTQAQFSDEVWISVPFWTTGTFASGTQRTDYIPTLTTPEDWPEVRARTSRISMYLNMLATGVSDDRALSDTEIQTLVAGLSGIKVDFNVGGLRVQNASPTNPPTVLCSDVGETTASRDFAFLRRWVENGGTLDSLTSDHAVTTFTMEKYASGEFFCSTATAGTYPADTEDYSFWTAELGDYFENLLERFFDRCNGTDGEGAGDPAFCSGFEFGTWEGTSAFTVTEASGFQWGERSTFGAVEFADVVNSFRTSLASRSVTDPVTGITGGIDHRYTHFNIDHWTTGACNDAFSPSGGATPECRTIPPVGTSSEDYCVGGDDQTGNNVMCRTWSYGRVIEMGRQLREMGVRFGFSNFLGIALKDETLDEAYGNQLAFDMAERAAATYAAAGGDPDFLQAFVWHRFPTATGPETSSTAALGLIHDILQDSFAETFQIPYLTDHFDGVEDWAWTFGPGAALAPPVLETDATGIAGPAYAALADEALEHVFAGVSVNRLDAASGATNEWLALQLRPQTVGADPTLAGGGLAVLVRFAADDTLDEVAVYSQGALLRTVTAVDLPQLKNLGTGWFRIEADLRGTRLRVDLSQGTTDLRVLDIRIDDAAPGGSLTEGALVLTSANAKARWDDLRIDQYRQGIERVEEDFSAGLTDWTQQGSAFSAAGGAAEISSYGFEELTSTAAAQRDLRISGKISMQAEPGWAGFHLRKKGNFAAPWIGSDGGFLVQLRENGTLTLYHKASTPTSLQIPTGLSPSQGPVYLGVELLDHRLRAFVSTGEAGLFDGAPAGETFVTCSTCDEAGPFGLAADQQTSPTPQGNVRVFDDIRVVQLR